MVPFSTQSSPSLLAVVEMRRVFEPASGSVIANTTLTAPLARPGSQVPRCSSVPKSAIISAEIAADTSSSSSGVPAAAISSQTRASSVSPPPPPPYSSGMLTPMNPASPRACHSSAQGRRAAARSA